MEYTKKVGMMGGTFSPIHLGHLLVAETAQEAFGLDEVLFIPSGVSYLKSNVLDAKSRMDMTSLAIEDNHHFALSTIEVDRKGDSYSYETIAQLKTAHPTTEYYFIVGSDSLMMMDNWVCPEKIFGEAKILVAPRQGCSEEQLQEKIAFLKEKFDAQIFVLPMNRIDISSSEIREKVANGKSIRYLVHPRVMYYIEKHHLYQKEES
mgnify:FL=1